MGVCVCVFSLQKEPFDWLITNILGAKGTPQHRSLKEKKHTLSYFPWVWYEADMAGTGMSLAWYCLRSYPYLSAQFLDTRTSQSQSIIYQGFSLVPAQHFKPQWLQLQTPVVQTSKPATSNL
jgi:hypothetical protein